MTNLEKGDLVKILSVDVTKPAYGVNKDMRLMVGGEYTIAKVILKPDYEIELKRVNVQIKDPNNGRTWAFHPDDLELVMKESDVVSDAMPETAMFDPKELLI